MDALKKIILFFEKNKKISFIILLIILGIMFYCSSIPGSTISFGSIWPSRIYHFSIFAGFAFFLLAILTKNKLKTKTILTAILISLIISILDEIHQIFVPLRSASIFDILLDLAGILLSIGIYSLIRNKN